MRSAFITLLASVLLAGSGHEAAIPYFSRSRAVSMTAADRQNYFVIDGDVWKFARPDLADLRLYQGQSQVPFVLLKQSGGSTNQETPVKILNLGEAAGHTEFDLDVGSVPEYSRIRLQLDARNFINKAQVQGRWALHDRSGTHLGSSTLYDFTTEGLGSNSVLKFPVSSFHYLHVRLGPGIRPDQVKAAYLSNFSETKAAWSPAGTCSAISGAAKQSVFECDVRDGSPVERITFTVPPGSVNFNRIVIVSDDKGNQIQSGSISRVHLKRAGQTVTSEELSLNVYSPVLKQIKVTVENGDDAPLPIQQVQALSFERRVYFDPQGRSTLTLYYGDSKLEEPSYDYAKFFQQSPEAVIAKLGPPQANAQFTGRPDERPWSERHKGVLWAVMLIAVAILGGIAVRGLKSSSPAARR